MAGDHGRDVRHGDPPRARHPAPRRHFVARPRTTGRPAIDPQRQPHPDNVAGPWFVDRACIDCDATRQVAPDLFARRDGQSVVVRQPDSAAEEERMWLAAMACPTSSVRRDPPLPRPRRLYPWQVDEGTWYAGFNAESSFGANAFLVQRRWGVAMIDAPRWHPDVVAWLADHGGLDHVLLTHRDDVADADRYAERFGARVWIHEDDRDAAPWATDLLRGEAVATLEPGLDAIPVPGHTRGSVAFVVDDMLFSGDSLYWSRRRQDLAIHASMTWYSLDRQLESLAHLNEVVSFAAVYAGHGDRHRTTAEDMHARLDALLARHRDRRP